MSRGVIFFGQLLGSDSGTSMPILKPHDIILATVAASLHLADFKREHAKVRE